MDFIKRLFPGKPEQRSKDALIPEGGKLQAGLPRDFRTASPKLLPRLRSRIVSELRWLYSVEENTPTPPPASRIVADHLAVHIEHCDGGNTVEIALPSLQEWGVSFDEAYAIALSNLARNTPPDFCCNVTVEGQAIAPMEGIYGAERIDDYNATRILLLEHIRRYPVKGDIVALIPRSNRMVFLGMDHGLRRMTTYMEFKSVLEKYLEGTSFWGAPCPLRLTADQWVPLPFENDTLGLRSLSAKYFVGCYYQQAAVLGKLPSRYRYDCDVGKSALVQDTKNNEAMVGAFWEEGKNLLLPKCDVVIFQSRDGSNTAIDWDHAFAVIRGLLEPLDMYPPRYRVRAFPTLTQFAEMERRASSRA